MLFQVLVMYKRHLEITHQPWKSIVPVLESVTKKSIKKGRLRFLLSWYRTNQSPRLQISMYVLTFFTFSLRLKYLKRHKVSCINIVCNNKREKSFHGDQACLFYCFTCAFVNWASHSVDGLSWLGWCEIWGEVIPRRWVK